MHLKKKRCGAFIDHPAAKSICPGVENVVHPPFVLLGPVVLPHLHKLAQANNSQAVESKRIDIATQLFEAYSALSCCCILFSPPLRVWGHFTFSRAGPIVPLILAVRIKRGPPGLWSGDVCVLAAVFCRLAASERKRK